MIKEENEKSIERIFNLKNEIVVITGGMGQLGTEYGEVFAKAGAKTAIFDIAGKPNSILTKLSKKYPIKFFRVDITDKKEVEAAVKKLEEIWGVPDVLINNAGIDAPPDKPELGSVAFENYPLDAFRKIYDSHFVGAVNCCQVIGGKMAKAGRGSIINVASHYGINPPYQKIYEYRLADGKPPFFKPLAYCVAKASLVYLTRYLAAYWGNKVRVNTLVPGGVYKDHDPRFVKAYSAKTILGRMAQKHEYNGAVLFLASDASSYMTGEMLIVDGGWTAK